ncbi:MAG: tRNA (guanosine(46)-N7)-methyltransferase TrmB [Coriobacteriia bacterium]|nr:tRNA (guanosine(46)-N7)-methyltransferase TrmB [Coriobacteriia bacterium]MBS5477873.1 tRNA (guanosine(46)-N7)-methyltransferase TrmB [Coriobacteriia bacterium]
MRARRPKNLEKRFEWYAPVIEATPLERASTWAQTWCPEAREVRLDLGCGKGSYTLRAAQAEPDVLFVGMDCDAICVSMAAKKALEAGVGNVVFTRANADDLARIFAPGELGGISLNYSSPFPPAKYASKRLTHVERLMVYRELLCPGARVSFKTDSAPLYEFSRIQFGLAGYDVLWETTDLYGEGTSGLDSQLAAACRISSEYEERLTAEGAKVHALVAALGPRPEAWTQTAELSLAAYLPEDLDSLTYIPAGMEDTVRNLRNRQANLRAKASRQAARAYYDGGGER